MSYSFSVKAPSKAAAKETVKQYFDANVVPHQPVHARDRAAVFANADSAIDLLSDDDSKDVAVSCHGYVSGNWSQDQSAMALSGVSVSVTASHVIREVVTAS